MCYTFPVKDVPQLRSRLLAALKEDGAFTDITTRALRAPTARRVHARFICKRPGVFCGGFLIKPLFSLIERSVVVKNVARDGARVRAGQTLALLSGRAAAILAGERTALNLLC
ncbi:MAG: nicotinate-nucleotide diphosphorylase (carboxylating), partial [Elusimicrobia bacterium]|nr:nicotinate-nucleotide diphosphorylase (carboxylating) [Elusimicrobiota bacterium]